MIRSSTEVLPKYLFLIIFAYFLLGENGAAAFHRLATTEELQNVPPATISNRTGYHFQSPKNWINDPNGPMYYKGIYHLFYQFNPKEPVWGNIVWAHSYSTDMINWNPLEPAIHPTKPFDINGCWSGSATILPGNKPVIMYTGIDERNRQVQNVAFPKNLSDPYLREWVKPDYNPVIQPEGDVNASSFRDPTTAWYGPDSHWKTVVGSRRGGEGVAVLYKSRDFIKWVKAKRPLHSVMGTGMWECPDFFPVLPNPAGLDNSAVGNGLKHVFKVSLDVNRFEYYTIGTYDFIRDRYVPDGLSPDNSTGLRFDYGNFYASKTFFDEGKGRRILWGWSNESDSAQDDWGKGWAGIQTIPRAVWLDGDGRRVVQWPIEEVRGLRRGQVGMYGEIVGGRGGVIEVRGVGGAQADVEVSFDVSGGLDGAERFDVAWTDPGRLCGQKGADEKGGVGPFGLYVLATEDREERTAVFFRIFRDGQKHVILMCHDPIKSAALIPYFPFNFLNAPAISRISQRIQPQHRLPVRLRSPAPVPSSISIFEEVRIVQANLWRLRGL